MLVALSQECMPILPKMRRRLCTALVEPLSVIWWASCGQLQPHARTDWLAVVVTVLLLPALALILATAGALSGHKGAYTDAGAGS